MQQEIPFAIKLQEESSSFCSGERHRLSSREAHPPASLAPRTRLSILLCRKDSEGSPVGEAGDRWRVCGRALTTHRCANTQIQAEAECNDLVN